MLDSLRRRIGTAAARPFGHAPYPLADTLDHAGDPGLCGPGSASWAIIGDVSGFIGGIRALLVQAAHPEVVAGVLDHSRYEEDPLGRLSRTSSYVTASTYGAMPEVERAIQMVRRAHRPVIGMSHRGEAYDAGDAGLAAWVHNALTDSFLVAYDRFGRSPLTTDDADRFVVEQHAIGRMLDADPLPATAHDLARWIAEHPSLAPSPGQAATTAFLARPPLTGGLLVGYRLLAAAAVATIPRRLRRVLGVRRRPGALLAGRIAIRILRWGLGSSPSWNLALVRAGAEVPAGLFVQPLPTQRSGSVGIGPHEAGT